MVVSDMVKQRTNAGSRQFVFLGATRRGTLNYYLIILYRTGTYVPSQWQIDIDTEKHIKENKSCVFTQLKEK